MKLKIDWQYVKFNVIVAGVVATLSLSLLMTAILYHDHHQQNYQRLTKKISRLYESIRVTNHNAQMIVKHAHAFQATIQQGSVEKEHRLLWVNAYQLKAERLKLRYAQYQISPQSKVTHPSLSHAMVPVFRSNMKLNVQLIHELDLLALLAEFEKVPGRFHVDACSITRANEQLSLRPDAVNFVAHCYIAWFTLKPQKTQQAVARR